MPSTHCAHCGSRIVADSDPSTFAYYCPACGYRERITEAAEAPDMTDDQTIHGANWRRAHGFPD